MSTLDPPSQTRDLDALLRRSAELKRELVEFARHNRFARARKQMVRELAEPSADELSSINMDDHFALQHRLHDGRTVVEHFVTTHRALSEDERALVLGWRDVVESVFEVQQHDRGGLLTINLLDDLNYLIHSNHGLGFVDDIPDGTFLIGRIVPLDDDAWLLSGATSTLPADDRDVMYRTVAEIAVRFPNAVFRNPAKVERGWEIQHAERRIFIEFFSSDALVMPGAVLAERMREFAHYRTYEARNEESRTIAETAKERYGMVPDQPEFDLSGLADAETVAVVYDDVEGLLFMVNFGMIEEAFANPRLASEEPHRGAVLGYLDDESIPPLAFRRLAKRFPDAASHVFRAALNEPDFDWDRDGEALLRRHKASHFERPPLPSVSVLSDAVADAVLGQDA